MAPNPLPSAPASQGRETPNLRGLISILGGVVFVGGYSAAVNVVVLEDLVGDLGAAPPSTDNLAGPLAAVGLGAFAALAVATLADRRGRKPMLLASTILFGLFSGATAVADNLAQFVILQFLSRVFLVAAYSIAITIVVERSPARRRGRALGWITFLGALGVPAAAGMNLLLGDTALGWRALYLVSLLSLLMIPALRSAPESERWIQRAKSLARPHMRASVASLLMVGAMFFLTYSALLAGTTWWAVYADIEAGFGFSRTQLLIGIAYGIGILGYLASGRSQDRLGRRRAGTLFMSGAMLFGAIVFQAHDVAVMTVAMTVALFCGFAVSPILAAYSAELFPTEMRASAVALFRGVALTSGAMFGPFVTGLLGSESTAARFPDLPVLGNLGDVLSLLTLLYLPAIFLIRKLPEPAGRELENIAAAAAAETSRG